MRGSYASHFGCDPDAFADFRGGERANGGDVVGNAGEVGRGCGACDLALRYHLFLERHNACGSTGRACGKARATALADSRILVQRSKARR